ncbi:MAG: cupredoxin domain-containing protein [Actinomycetota bacterium]|nr:cupredoxin domain-containing protein [Actinomycetota bacterium]
MSFARHRMTLLPTVTAVFALAAAGCGGGGSEEGGAAGGAQGGAAMAGDNVTVRGFKFMPAAIKVKAGSRLTFDNRDTAGHTATADAGGFDTGDVQKGESKTVVVKGTGTIPYHCDFHPFMKGQVVVE